MCHRQLDNNKKQGPEATSYLSLKRRTCHDGSASSQRVEGMCHPRHPPGQDLLTGAGSAERKSKEQFRNIIINLGSRGALWDKKAAAGSRTRTTTKTGTNEANYSLSDGIIMCFKIFGRNSLPQFDGCVSALFPAFPSYIRCRFLLSFPPIPVNFRYIYYFSLR